MKKQESKKQEEIKMKNKLMIGLWRYTINVPPSLWEKQIFKAKKKFNKEFALLTEDHRIVHHFVVKELPMAGKPLSPEIISEKLTMPLKRVVSLLDDLEKRMTFLFRNNNGDVIWAYPATVKKTPHQVTFNTGEQLYAA
jgi:hypothetical protein